MKLPPATLSMSSRTTLPAGVRLFAVLAPLLLLLSCDLYTQDEYEEQYVIESWLIATEPLPEVRVSVTAPFQSVYTFEEAAVRGALVRLLLLDQNGHTEQVYSYKPHGPGIYMPESQHADTPVVPGATYRLEVDVPGPEQHRIEATTTIPDTLHIVQIIRDRAVYQSPDQLEFRISTGNTLTRQNYFIYSTRSHEPEPENITPFWADAVEEIDEAVQIRTNIVNEANFDRNDDQTINLRMPWIGIAFYGRNTITTFSLDDNAYDFFRSQPVQTGGGPSTLSPGEIQNILYHVNGGIGLLAGLSRLEIEVRVDRP